jgi:hypothetical protein
LFSCAASALNCENSFGQLRIRICNCFRKFDQCQILLPGGQMQTIDTVHLVLSAIVYLTVY